MSDVELLEFKAKLEVLEKLFQQIQRSNDSLMKEVKASELSRREVLLKNFSQEVTIILRDRHVGKNQQADYVESNDTGVMNTAYKTKQSQNHHLTEQGLVLQNQQTLREQDNMITEIGFGVEKLHRQAIEIGDESKHHTKILSNLDDNVDETAIELKAEAKHADTIRRKSETFHLYICILIEIIIIIIIIIVVFSSGSLKV